MCFCHIKFVVQDLQRMWLHVWGILNYMEIYKHRMDGHAPSGEGVADTIGTFTTSICVSQDVFLSVIYTPPPIPKILVGFWLDSGWIPEFWVVNSR